MRQTVVLVLWAVATSALCGQQSVAGAAVPAGSTDPATVSAQDFARSEQSGPGIADDPLYAEADRLWRAGQLDQLLALVTPQAELGNPAAQHLLGVFYAHGRGVLQDDELAVQWWRKAAEQGSAKAQNELGVMLASGAGTAVDYGEAVTWFRKSAEQGLALGQANLGGMYWKGMGVSKDAREAVAWFSKAAEQGLAWAQLWLGDAYLAGAGVPMGRREEQAMQWYGRAAEQDYAEAQFALAQLYNGGRVRVDWSRTVYWLARAARNGHGGAAEALPHILPMLKKRVRTGMEIRAEPNASAAVVRTARTDEYAYELARVDGWLAVYLVEGHTLGYISLEPTRR